MRTQVHMLLVIQDMDKANIIGFSHTRNKKDNDDMWEMVTGMNTTAKSWKHIATPEWQIRKKTIGARSQFSML